MKRRTVLLLAMMTMTLVVASGVALAQTISCSTNSCAGTDQDDTMTNTYDSYSFMNAKRGADTMYGRGGPDDMVGGTGKDVLRGGEGNDELVGGDMSASNSDMAGDHVYGGSGQDTLMGGYATAGVDYLYGGDGDDEINAYRFTNMETATKEVIDCGAGSDTVRMDKGLDVETNCEYVYLY
jgi:Ca2+-binding RTX toxin-like protein